MGKKKKMKDKDVEVEGISYDPPRRIRLNVPPQKLEIYDATLIEVTFGSCTRCHMTNEIPVLLVNNIPISRPALCQKCNYEIYSLKRDIETYV